MCVFGTNRVVRLKDVRIPNSWAEPYSARVADSHIEANVTIEDGPRGRSRARETTVRVKPKPACIRAAKRTHASAEHASDESTSVTICKGCIDGRSAIGESKCKKLNLQSDDIAEGTLECNRTAGAPSELAGLRFAKRSGRRAKSMKADIVGRCDTWQCE
jgi:hypothetical protein